MTTYVDNSTLSAFARCPSYAIMRYHLGYTSRDEAAALKAGTAFHAAMEVHLRGGAWHAVNEAFNANYEEWAKANVDGDDRLSFYNVGRILECWCDDHPLETLPYYVHPDFIEVGVAQPLDDNGDYVITGRFDAAVQSWDRDDWYVMDHKTTGRLDQNFVRKFQMDSQMSTYIWVLSQTVPNVVGAYVNAIELKRLPSDTKRKCKDHGVVYAECGHLHYNSQLFMVQRTPAELDEWRTTALALAQEYSRLTAEIKSVADIGKARMRGMFNGSCAYCEDYDWCLSGREPELVNAMFVYSPWQPWLGIIEKEAA